MRSWGFIRGAASGFGGARVWGKKHTVNLYLTMSNYGNKIGFGGYRRDSWRCREKPPTDG